MVVNALKLLVKRTGGVQTLKSFVKLSSFVFIINCKFFEKMEKNACTSIN